jgi:hypothetical protein
VFPELAELLDSMIDALAKLHEQAKRPTVATDADTEHAIRKVETARARLIHMMPRDG